MQLDLERVAKAAYQNASFNAAYLLVIASNLTLATSKYLSYIYIFEFGL